LNNIEKQLLTNLLRDDAGVADNDPTSSTQLSWRQVRYVFIDWTIYLHGLIAIGNLAVILCLTTFLPTLMEDMHHFKTEAHLITATPYVVACVCCLLTSYSSSRLNEHSYHLAFCLLISLLGFILMLTLFDRGKVVIYISTTVACCGAFSAFPLQLSWLTNNVGGHTKRPMAISFVLGMGQIGGIFMHLVRLLFLIAYRIIYEVDL
jgi:predicted MFS family arabinose efflux permease